MAPHDELRADLTRRAFLRTGATGLGTLALGSLLARDGLAGPGDDPLAVRAPHHRPRAKRILRLNMAGAPSQIDLFDPKPELEKYDRKPCPAHLLEGERFAFIKGVPELLGSPYAFERRGESGAWFSELLPNMASLADSFCVVRSMQTTQFNHAPAQMFLSTGHERFGRPSMGSWVSYGLGSTNDDLPAYCVLLSGPWAPGGGSALWGPGFLPSVHQGVLLRSQGDPVPFLSNPDGLDRASRRRLLDTVGALNAKRHDETGDPEIETRIRQYELAYRMQASVPGIADLTSEPEGVLAAYGAAPGKRSYANNCLLARRLLEHGVRFVELYHWGWDSHGTGPHDDIVTSLPNLCLETDRATAALLRDLERRGLLDDTLVVWGGEFGRTPMNEERGGSKYLGRDHHPHAFTVLLAGGGVAAGRTVGATDELGYHVVDTPVSVHDLHATLLHQLGFDHEGLTYPFQGRDFRLTDVHGRVVRELLA